MWLTRESENLVGWIWSHDRRSSKYEFSHNVQSIWLFHVFLLILYPHKLLLVNACKVWSCSWYTVSAYPARKTKAVAELYYSHFNKALSIRQGSANTPMQIWSNLGPYQLSHRTNLRGYRRTSRTSDYTNVNALVRITSNIDLQNRRWK